MDGKGRGRSNVLGWRKEGKGVDQLSAFWLVLRRAGVLTSYSLARSDHLPLFHTLRVHARTAVWPCQVTMDGGSERFFVLRGNRLLLYVSDIAAKEACVGGVGQRCVAVITDVAGDRKAMSWSERVANAGRRVDVVCVSSIAMGRGGSRCKRSR